MNPGPRRRERVFTGLLLTGLFLFAGALTENVRQLLERTTPDTEQEDNSGRVLERLHAAGISPHEARYWRRLEGGPS